MHIRAFYIPKLKLALFKGTVPGRRGDAIGPGQAQPMIGHRLIMAAIGHAMSI